MHSQRDHQVPLKESETRKIIYMSHIAKDAATKKAHPPCDTEKKVHANDDDIKDGEIAPTENDVLLGRGGKNNSHSGNEKLRELAREVAAKYHVSSKKEKSYLSRSLVQKVQEMDPPGRFLRRHPKNNRWEDLSADDDKCREKCAQVLRDAVAFIGLKDAPLPREARFEQARQQQMQQQMQQLPPLQQPPPSSFPMGGQNAALPRLPPFQINPVPFAMSAASSNSIMNHHQQMMSGANFSQQRFQFPSSNSSFNNQSFATAGRGSLGLGPSTAGSFEPSLMSTGQQQQQQFRNQTYNNMAQTMHLPPGMRPSEGMRPNEVRQPKRRRLSGSYYERRRNSDFSYYDQYAETLGTYDRRSSMNHSYPGATDRRLSTSNRHPVDYQQLEAGPGPRLASRRDSLFGNLSLPGGSDHSGPSLHDFELFPDISATADHSNNNLADEKDNDEFATDFC